MVEVTQDHDTPFTKGVLNSSPGHKQNGVGVGEEGVLAWRGYKACTLLRQTRENGCGFCCASMPCVLAFLILIYLRVGLLGGLL